MIMIKRLKIPESRIAVLIGQKGSTKRKISDLTKTKITIEDDEAVVEGESLNVLDAENIVKAISRGFSPENASLLLNEENSLMILDLPKEDKELKRIRSRLIGTNGKARRNIERLTRVKISVFGRTVSIIGSYENIEKARKSIEKIIKGSAHRFVYQELEKSQKESSSFLYAQKH